MTKRFTNEAHVLSGSVRRAIDARGDARGGGVAIPGRTREEPYGFVFGDPGSAATRPGARRGGAASPDPRDWHDAIDPASMPNFGDQLAEVVKYLPGGGRRNFVGWLTGGSGRMPTGGQSTGEPRGGAGRIPDAGFGRGPGVPSLGEDAMGVGYAPLAPGGTGEVRIAQANLLLAYEDAADPPPSGPMRWNEYSESFDSAGILKQAPRPAGTPEGRIDRAWLARKADRETRWWKDIKKGTAEIKKESKAAEKAARKKAEEREAEERKEKKDPRHPRKAATPNPFDDGGGPTDPRIRLGREALPNPGDDSGPVGPWSSVVQRQRELTPLRQ